MYCDALAQVGAGTRAWFAAMPHPHHMLPSTTGILTVICVAIPQVGADIRAWFAAMPRPHRMLPQKRPATALGIPTSSGTSRFALFVV